MNRGHNREPIFDDDIDCEIFLEAVRRSSDRHELEVHGFAVMKNHFHLLVTPHHPSSISGAVKAFASKYCFYSNRKRNRVGSIWNGRYHDVPIESAWQWLVCLRYIELNPVRARVVTDPRTARWTSYGVHAFGDSTHSWLADHELLRGLGPTSRDRQEVYRALCAAPLSDAELTLMRSAPVLQLAAAG